MRSITTPLRSSPMELGCKVEHEVVVTIEERLIDDHVDDRGRTSCPARRSSSSWATSTTARPPCSTRIRSANVAAGEAGGITQHIGAYRVHGQRQRTSPSSTPRATRRLPPCAPAARMVTDIAILVVAADDGIMPQTVEAINHAKAGGRADHRGRSTRWITPARTPTASNSSSPNTISCPKSGAATRSSARSPRRQARASRSCWKWSLLMAEMHGAQGQPEPPAQAARSSKRSLDKGRGPVATVLVQNGTLHTGDIIIAGTAVGRVRAMTNDRGERIEPMPAPPCRWRSSACPKCRARATCSTPSPTSAWRALSPSSAKPRSEDAAAAGAGKKVSLEDLFAPASRRASSRTSTSSSRRTCRAAPRPSRHRSKSSPTRKCACASSTPASARSTSRTSCSPSTSQRHHRRLQRPSGQRRARQRRAQQASRCACTASFTTASTRSRPP